MSRPRTSDRSLTSRLGRNALAALSGGLLVLGLAACSDADAGESNQPPKAEFAEAKVLGAAMDAALAKATTAKVATVGANNAGDESTGKGTVRFGGDFAFDVQTGGTLPALRVLSVDDKVFSRPVQEIKGKPWVRIDQADPKNETAGFFGAASELMRGAVDAHLTTKALPFATSFEPIGKQALAEGSFDAYRANLDLEALIASLPDETREAARKNLFAGSMLYTIYLEDDDRPRRIVLESTLNGVPSTQTTDYTEWGAAATFEAPPADQVTDLSAPSGK